jgi:hypothetical protein
MLFTTVSLLRESRLLLQFERGDLRLQVDDLFPNQCTRLPSLPRVFDVAFAPCRSEPRLIASPIAWMMSRALAFRDELPGDGRRTEGGDGA